MNDIHIESTLRHIREEQERAAQRALQKYELELLRKETPHGTEMHIWLAKNFGLHLDRRLKPSKR